MFWFKILKYTRPLNLLVMLLTVAMLYFFVLPKAIGFPYFNDVLYFFLLSIPVIFIGAAGYLLNDFFDFEIDKINRKGKELLRDHFTTFQVIIAYLLFNVIGLMVSIYLGKNALWLSLSNILLLVLYAQWKRAFLIGNIAIAYLCSSVILWVWIYSLMGDQEINFQIIKSYFIFSFLLSLAREIVKDMEDIEGDRIQGCRTVPILLGKKSVKFFILFIFCLLTYFLLEFGYTSTNFKLIYLLLMVILPLTFIGIRLINATTKDDFSAISKWCKVVMVTGLCSIVVP